MVKAPSLAVVGSGPAAFYTALRVGQKIPNLKVSVFEKHAFPFGLTRYGVAPDHPEVKNCQDRFTEVASNKAFKFYGNCEVGRNIDLKSLSVNFDAVLLAYGASADRDLGIPTVPGVFSARAFVGWYNGEPGFEKLDFSPWLASAKNVSIIGNGNVALDIARILLKSPAELAKTDIATTALDSLKCSSVESVEIVGRRGLLNSAFTNKELRELIKLPVKMLPVAPAAETEIMPQSRAEKRKLDLVRQAGAGSVGEKTWQLRFLQSPKQFNGAKLESIEWEINEMHGNAVKGTGKTITTKCDLAFTSIGYRSEPLRGLETIGGEFDLNKHRVLRESGKVSGTSNVFAAGWVATGPVGVIASTMMDSFSVGDEIAKFLSSCETCKSGLLPIDTKQFISWGDWAKIDAEEIRRGESTGRAREKFTTNEQALRFLKEN